jgi:hypothetical protein
MTTSGFFPIIKIIEEHVTCIRAKLRRMPPQYEPSQFDELASTMRRTTKQLSDIEKQFDEILQSYLYSIKEKK